MSCRVVFVPRVPKLLPMRLDAPFVEKKGAEPTVATLLSAMQLLLLV